MKMKLTDEQRALIIKLRELIGRGMFSCHEALKLNDWDFEKAKKYICHSNRRKLITWGK